MRVDEVEWARLGYSAGVAPDPAGLPELLPAGRTWVISRPNPAPPPPGAGEPGAGELGVGGFEAGVLDTGVPEAGVADVPGDGGPGRGRELSREEEPGGPECAPAPDGAGIPADPSVWVETGFTLSSIHRRMSPSAARSRVRSPSRWRDIVSMS